MALHSLFPLNRAVVCAGSACALALVLGLAAAPFALHAQLPATPGQPASAQNSVSQRAPVGSIAGTSTLWRDLTERQRTALAPLQHTWGEIAPDHQQKWLEIAARIPKMQPQEQARIQTRMIEWAQLSPQERGRARLRFQEAKKLPAPDRQARWQEFQALTPEQRHELSERAAASAAHNGAASSSSGSAGAAAERRAASVTNAAAVSSVASPRSAMAGSGVRASVRPVREEAIAPAIVQAKPGVTTTLMSKRTAAAPHQKVGTPRIATASDRVDASTLLPRRPAPNHGATGGAATAVPPSETANDPNSNPGAPTAPQPAVAPLTRESMEMPHPEYYK